MSHPTTASPAPATLVDRLASARDGARDVLPLLLGVLPLAMTIGVTARATGADLGATWAASFLLTAGTAQLSIVQLLSDGAAPATIIATATVINARFIAYSLAFGRWFAHEPLWRRLALAFPLVDQLFLICQERFGRADDRQDRRTAYYLGAAVVLVTAWSSAQALSMAFAGSLPSPKLFEAATPIVFASLLVPAVVDRPALLAAVVAAAATVAGAQLPQHTGLLFGIAVGLVAGIVARERSRR